MAANSIGNASLKLSSNGSALLNDLSSTGQGIKKWAADTKATVNGAFKTGAAGAAGGIAGGLSGGLKSALPAIGGAIGMIWGPVGSMIGSAIGGTLSTISDAVLHPFEKLKEFGGIVKQAATLGVSASQLQGLQRQLATVGIEAEQTGALFAQMGKNVADAAGGHGRAAPALAQLGIDAKQLLSLPVDEQFKAIADAVAKLPPGAQQASAALHIFGGEGSKLLPILQKGGKGIQDFIEMSKKTGAVLSDEQLKAAADAQKAWKEARKGIEAVWDGLVNRATIIAAPVIKFIGNAISKAFALLAPVFEWLGRVVGEIARIAEAVFEVLGQWFEEAVKWVKELIGGVEEYTGSWPKVEDVVLAVLKAVAQSLGYVWDTLKGGVGVGAYVIGFLVQSFGKLVNSFKDTIKGLLDIAGELPDSLGGDFFRNASKNVDKFGAKIKDTGTEMMNWGKAQMAAWGDSPVKIGAWFDKLKNKVKKEEGKLKADVAPEAKKPEYKPVEALLKGSKEAYSVEARFRFENPAGKKVDEKQLDEQKKIVARIEALLDLFRNSIPLKAG
jgi:phage-related protein